MDIQTLFKEKTVVLDGAMGTSFQNMQLNAAHYGGDAYEGCHEALNLYASDQVEQVHGTYLTAGADVIETNTFGATSIVLADYGLDDRVVEINKTAVKIAKDACSKFKDKPRFVCGSMGPTSKALSLSKDISFTDMQAAYFEQAKALISAGVDYLLLETCMDTLNIKAGYCGILDAFNELGKTIPVSVSVTIEDSGTMLSGQTIEALCIAVSHMDLLYVGMNCALGPKQMADYLSKLHAISSVPVVLVPNAGMPDENGQYLETPEVFSKTLTQYIKQGWLNGVGGCCGTTPDHIEALTAVVENVIPRQLVNKPQTQVSGLLPLTIKDRCYLVGERANVIGSRIFKTLISDEKFDEAADVAKRQINAGADIVDICVSNSDRDEKSDMVSLLSIATKTIKVPFMIDAQDPAVIESAFQKVQGKCILNSVNLENGKPGLDKVIPIIKKYGAAVVVGCIEAEMPITAKDKLAVAKKAFDILTKEYGLNPSDLIFDPLVFPCGTGDEKYKGSAKETIAAISLIKAEFPTVKTILGVSNVSFGLPILGREVLNSVFLERAIQAGLDFAIINTEKLVSFSDITHQEALLCDQLIQYTSVDPITPFVTYFREKQPQQKQAQKTQLTVQEQLINCILMGQKTGLIAALDQALQQMAPLDIINGPLMQGMDQVGVLFNKNDLIVAEVLRSAEVMKAAVTYLEPHLSEKEASSRGTVLIATVKGDVHDIGKNLVDIILSNNGYDVIDLGIKCDDDAIIQAVKKYQPDVIGLSGLLVKSAQQMILTAKSLKAADICVPLFIGGAALTENFTKTKIVPEYLGDVLYCKDAMTCLTHLKQYTFEK